MLNHRNLLPSEHIKTLFKKTIEKGNNFFLNRIYTCKKIPYKIATLQQIKSPL